MNDSADIEITPFGTSENIIDFTIQVTNLVLSKEPLGIRNDDQSILIEWAVRRPLRDIRRKLEIAEYHGRRIGDPHGDGERHGIQACRSVLVAGNNVTGVVTVGELDGRQRDEVNTRDGIRHA
jgi:hypothetical protein